ncbi:MAG: hypothetical protein OXE43_15405 [Chloroflexi bacterium]|nr:hypothetical protein [Chloroflexota bacterium]
MTRDERLAQANQELTYATTYRDILVKRQRTNTRNPRAEEKQAIDEVLAEANRQIIRLEAESEALKQMPAEWQMVP